MNSDMKDEIAMYERIALRCTKKEKDQIREWARAQNRSMSNYILHVCKEWEKGV